MNTDILNMIAESARMGAAEALKRMQPKDDRISRHQAVREYGYAFLRDNADRLAVTVVGNRRYYSRAELEQAQASRNVAIIAMRIENGLLINNNINNKKPSRK